MTYTESMTTMQGASEAMRELGEAMKRMVDEGVKRLSPRQHRAYDAALADGMCQLDALVALEDIYRNVADEPIDLFQVRT